MIRFDHRFLNCMLRPVAKRLTIENSIRMTLRLTSARTRCCFGFVNQMRFCFSKFQFCTFGVGKRAAGPLFRRRQFAAATVRAGARGIIGAAVMATDRPAAVTVSVNASGDDVAGHTVSYRQLQNQAGRRSSASSCTRRLDLIGPFAGAAALRLPRRERPEVTVVLLSWKNNPLDRKTPLALGVVRPLDSKKAPLRSRRMNRPHR